MKVFNGVLELEAEVDARLGWSDWHSVRQDKPACVVDMLAVVVP